nr:endonuclease domain-containing protein [Sphingomonas formosensis]
MRSATTPAEQRLWLALRSPRLEGFKFSRQIMVSGCICDFVCRSLASIVQIDGDTHDRKRDADRDHLFGRNGYRVVRFTNAEVMGNLEGVLPAIVETAKGQSARRFHRFSGGGATHPPAPSLGRKRERI